MTWKCHLHMAGLILALVCFYLGVMSFREGELHFAALNFATGIFAMWVIRQLPDYVLTKFCMWWMKRKAAQAVAYIEKLKQGLKENNIDEN